MAEHMAAAELDSRYGRPSPARRRRRLILAAAAGAVVLAGGIWLAAANLADVNSAVEVGDLGHRVNDQFSVSIDFRLSMTPGSTASCALQAQNAQHGIVGWKIIDIPSSDRFTRTFTETVRTSERAVTGLIYRCWLT